RPWDDVLIEGGYAYYGHAQGVFRPKTHIYKVDLHTGQTTATKEVENGFSPVSAGEGGIVLLNRYVRDHGGAPALLRLDAQSLEVTGRVVLDGKVWHQKPRGMQSSSSCVTVGFGAIWVMIGYHAEVVRIDSRTMQVTTTIPVPPETECMDIGN